MLTLLLILFGLALGVVGSEFGDAWPYHAGLMVGLLGTVVSAVAAVRQYRESRPFTLLFDESSWQKGDESFELIIKHRKGKSVTHAVYERLGAGYEEVFCDCRVLSAGQLVVGAGRPFEGKVVVT